MIQCQQVKKCILVCTACLSLFSCRTIRQPESVFVPPDYTEADAIYAEQKRIARLLEEEHAVEALWRALLLGDDETTLQCAAQVERELRAAVDAGRYLDAGRLHRSLCAAGFSARAQTILPEQELSRHIVNDVPGLTVDARYLPRTIADCINATVTVWVDQGIRIQNGAGRADRVIGSGFFIDHRGYIITNHHVIASLVDPRYEGYARLYIKLAADSETRIPARVIGYDSALDIALLKTEVDAPFVLALGSSRDLNVGDRVSAIGTPLGLEGTITSGIVSSVDRKLFMTGAVFQIDAAVNAGNSGGPLIDANMRVQAVVFAGIKDYQGLNFAIPVEYVRQDLPYLFRGEQRMHPWIGAYGRTTRANGTAHAGLEVQYRMPGGSAHRAGIGEGAVITAIDGQAKESLEAMQS
ncbi:MAG: serine protease, partial [Treponema sp.]|nr:serine protease [Treponema sp.]